MFLFVIFIVFSIFTCCNSDTPSLPPNINPTQNNPTQNNLVSSIKPNTKQPETSNCKLDTLPIFGPDEAILKGDFTSITSYITNLVGAVSQIFPELDPLIEAIDGIVGKPHLPEECIDHAHKKIKDKFDEIKQKTLDLQKKIVNAVYNKTDATTRHNLMNTNYVMEVRIVIASYIEFIENILEKDGLESDYKFLRNKCRDPDSGFKVLINKYKNLLSTSCENELCFPKIIASLTEVDSSVGKDFVESITLDGLRLQYISIFCASLDETAKDPKTKTLEDQTQIILGTIEAAKKMVLK